MQGPDSLGATLGCVHHRREEGDDRCSDLMDYAECIESLDER